MSRSNWPSSRPAVQPSSRPDEASYPSRIEREKITARPQRHLVQKLRVYCAVNRIDMQDVLDHLLEQFFADKDETGRPAVQPSTVLTDRVCVDPDQDQNTHRTNKTHSGRPAVQPSRDSKGAQPMLPATGGELIQMTGSKFDLKTIERYAYESYRHAKRHMRDGIRNPQGWAIAAHRSGRFDQLIQEFIDNPRMFEG